MSVAPATQREVQEFDEFTACLEAPDTVDVRARVAGTVGAMMALVMGARDAAALARAAAEILRAAEECS